MVVERTIKESPPPGILDKPWPTCNSRRNKFDALCRHEAGWGTKHKGRGRCRLHGGANKPGLNPDMQPSAIRKRAMELKNDPRMMQAEEWVAMMGAIAEDYIYGHEAAGALPELPPGIDLAKIAKGEEEIPPNALAREVIAKYALVAQQHRFLAQDFHPEAVKILAELTKAINRKHELERDLGGLMSIRVVNVFVDQFVGVIAHHVKDNDVIRAIARDAQTELRQFGSLEAPSSG